MSKLFPNKKSEVSHIFVTLLTLSVFIVIVIFGFGAIQKIMDTIQDTELANFANEIKEDLNLAGANKGSGLYSYKLPSKVKTIVFLDDTNKKALLNNDWVQSQPVIKDIVQSGEQKNMFLFSKTGKLIKSFYIGDITTGQIGTEICTGIGMMNISGSQMEMRISNLPGKGVMLGEECTGLLYVTFQGPYSDDILPIDISGNTRLDIGPSKRSIMINLNTVTGLAGIDSYFHNASLNTTPLNIIGVYDGVEAIDRLFFSIDLPDDSDIRFRISFKSREFGDWVSYGPNLSADLPNETGYYYEYPGQYITPPGFTYDNVRVQIDMFANHNLTVTPIFNWLKLSYYGG